MKKVLLVLVIVLGCVFATGCKRKVVLPKSTSGVKKVTVAVAVGSDGLTVEQRNIAERYREENKPGAIKHLYVISAYSGQVLIYSSVEGKVTSSGKRLSPYSVAAIDGQYVGSTHNGVPVQIGDRIHRTPEVLQDDGTYGHSIPYLYWTDTKGIFHKHYVSGGQIIHISAQPLSVKGIIINMELSGSN